MRQAALIEATAAWLALAFSPSALAETIIADPSGASLQEVIDHAPAGQVVHLNPGEYAGPVKIDKPITLEGDAGAVLNGDQKTNVITVSAPDTVIRGLTVRGSGASLEEMDSGIFLEQTASRARVEGNRIEKSLFGIYIHGAPDAVVQGNKIIGNRDIRLSETGNGVTVWNAPGAKVIGNDIHFGRDGIFVISSKKNLFRGNSMHDLRFAVHYMYAGESEVSENISVGNHIGFAIMFSPKLEVARNSSDHDVGHGLMFNFANYSNVHDNVVKNSAEKCLFIYDANFNSFYRNWFEGCQIGIHFTAGSEQNDIFENAFINNRNQVKYVGTRFVEWSKSGRGNYWSDNPAFDLDGDGVADAAYRPNDIIDRVMWEAPLTKVLANSPAVQVIRWAQSQFPSLQTGGVVDSAPLMEPPRLERPRAAR